MNPLSNQEREALAVWAGGEIYKPRKLPERITFAEQKKGCRLIDWLPPNTDDTPEWQRMLLIETVMSDAKLSFLVGCTIRDGLFGEGRRDIDNLFFPVSYTEIVATPILTLSRAILECMQNE